MSELNSLVSLIGMRGYKPAVNDTESKVYYFIDDVEGITMDMLADLANSQDGTGRNVFDNLLDSAARMMAGAVDGLIPTRYSITNNQLASNFCSSCKWGVFYNNVYTGGSGILIKDTSFSEYSFLVINSFTAKINNNGQFSITITDGKQTRNIDYTFRAGVEVEFKELNFTTTEKSVKIFFDNPSVMAAIVDCPAASGCGCSGSPKAPQNNNFSITGFQNGSEATMQSGFIPCVTIGCSYDNIVSGLILTSPRIFGLAELYLLASKVFAYQISSPRNNRNTNIDTDEMKENQERYYALYLDALNGTSKQIGVKDAIATNLQSRNDSCIICNSLIGVAWGVG